MRRMKMLAAIASSGLLAIAMAAGCESGLEEPSGETPVYVDHDGTLYRIEGDEVTEVGPSPEVPYDPGTCSSAEWRYCAQVCGSPVFCGNDVDDCVRSWFSDVGAFCVCGISNGVAGFCGS